MLGPQRRSLLRQLQRRRLCVDAGRATRWKFGDGTGRNVHPADLSVHAPAVRWGFISQRETDEFVAPQYAHVQEMLRKGVRAIGGGVVPFGAVARDGSETTTTEAVAAAAEDGGESEGDLFSASVLSTFAGMSQNDFEEGAAQAYARVAELFARGRGDGGGGGGEEPFDFRGAEASSMVVPSLGQLLHEQQSQLARQGLRTHLELEDGSASAQVVLVAPLLVRLGSNGRKVAHLVDRSVGVFSTRFADWLVQMLMLAEDRWAPRVGGLLAWLNAPPSSGAMGGGGGREGGEEEEEEEEHVPAAWRLRVHVALQVNERFALARDDGGEAVKPGRSRTMQLRSVMDRPDDEGNDGWRQGPAPAPELHAIIYEPEKEEEWREKLEMEERWRAEEEELATDAGGFATRMHFLEFEAPIDGRAAAMRGPPDDIQFRLVNINGALLHMDVMKDY